MLNHIVLMGRLTRDPELRRTQSGVPVVSFTLAVDHDIPNKETGERGVDFIDIVAWRQTAEFVNKYFSKGRMAVVSGRLQIRNWKDANTGANRRAAEVVADSVYFGDSKRDGDNAGSYNGNSYAGGNNYANGGNSSYAAGNNGYDYNNSYAAPAAPAAPAASDFAMLEDEDGELPF